MQNYKEDIYINLAYRVGCACFPVFSICYHRSEIWSWSAVIISFSCITLGIMRWVSIRWFGREKLSNAPLRSLIDGLLALPYCFLLSTLIFHYLIAPEEDTLILYGIVALFTILEIAAYIVDKVKKSAN
ncbi:MAG: hypothetical protein K2I12_09600 [Duncaniella sp.]|nr:hypothetical protein [Duncaniella sp.]MDE6764886.1 hypothetical protein [Duncaniella sp.]